MRRFFHELSPESRRHRFFISGEPPDARDRSVLHRGRSGREPHAGRVPSRRRRRADRRRGLVFPDDRRRRRGRLRGRRSAARQGHRDAAAGAVGGVRVGQRLHAISGDDDGREPRDDRGLSRLGLRSALPTERHDDGGAAVAAALGPQRRGRRTAQPARDGRVAAPALRAPSRRGRRRVARPDQHRRAGFSTRSWPPDFTVRSIRSTRTRPRSTACRRCGPRATFPPASIWRFSPCPRPRSSGSSTTAPPPA